jgi:hypothetical protein
MTHMLPAHLSEAQRAFVHAAESVGATAPAAARPLTDLPRLSARELDELVERGLVREAANWSYYVFRARHGDLTASIPPAPPLAHGPWTRARYLRTLAFWVIVILIPVLFLQLSR